MKEIKDPKKLVEAVKKAKKDEKIVYLQGPVGLGKTTPSYRIWRWAKREVRKKGAELETKSL